MANKKRKSNYVFMNRIKYYREKFNLTQGELAEYLDCTDYRTVSNDEKNNGTDKGVSLFKAYDYIDAFREISAKATHGEQVLDLKVDDLFFRVYVEDPQE